MGVGILTSIELDQLYSLWDPKNKKCINVPASESIGDREIVDLGGKKPLTAQGLSRLDDAGFIAFNSDSVLDYCVSYTYTLPPSAFSINIWFRSRFNQNTQTVLTYSLSGTPSFVLQASNKTTIKPTILGYSDFPFTTTDMQNKWVNICWTRDTTTGRNIFYRDGEKLGEFYRDALVPPAGDGDLFIGQLPAPGVGPVEDYFDGLKNLDGDFGYLSIYSKELSATSVRQNYNALRKRFGL